MAKVLVVDDSSLLRTVLCDYLRDLGHEPLAASTPVEAIALCASHRPDLVIKDLIMKDTNPTALMKDLRRHRSDLPIVICSTSGMRREIRDALHAGADDFLIKPFSRHDIDVLIRRHVIPV